jgi:hypothetical protein
LQLSEGTHATQYRPADTDWVEILPREDERDHVQRMLADVFRGQAGSSTQFTFGTDSYFGDWHMDAGRILLSHPCKVVLPAAKEFPKYKLDLEFVVASKGPVDLTIPLGTGTPPDWEIQKIRIVRAAALSKRDD